MSKICFEGVDALKRAGLVSTFQCWCLHSLYCKLCFCLLIPILELMSKPLIQDENKYDTAEGVNKEWELFKSFFFLFRYLRIRFCGLEIKHLKAHNFVRLYFIIISRLRRPIELKCLHVCYFKHVLRYTPSEKTGIWQLPIVSSVFQNQLHLMQQYYFW